jgi:hypothetical protein
MGDRVRMSSGRDHLKHGHRARQGTIACLEEAANGRVGNEAAGNIPTFPARVLQSRFFRHMLVARLVGLVRTPAARRTYSNRYYCLPGSRSTFGEVRDHDTPTRSWLMPRSRSSLASERTVPSVFPALPVPGLELLGHFVGAKNHSTSDLVGGGDQRTQDWTKHGDKADGNTNHATRAAGMSRV